MHREGASHTCEAGFQQCPLSCEAGTTRPPRPCSRYRRWQAPERWRGATREDSARGVFAGGMGSVGERSIISRSYGILLCISSPHARFEGSHRHGLDSRRTSSLWQLHRTRVAPISFRRMGFARCLRVALKAAPSAPASASGSRRAQALRVRALRPCFEQEEAAQIAGCPGPRFFSYLLTLFAAPLISAASTRNNVQGGSRRVHAQLSFMCVVGHIFADARKHVSKRRRLRRVKTQEANALGAPAS